MWQRLSQTSVYKSWSGYAFESLCLKHIPQIKKALQKQDRDRDIKKANFYLLKNVNHPIVMAEIGFLSNQQDRQQLTSEEGQTEIAQAIYKVIQQ